MVGQTQWLKRASRTRISAVPRVAVVHESDKGEKTVKTNHTFEWELCVIESELDTRCCPSPTERHEDNEAVMAGVRKNWPTALSEEIYDWPGTEIVSSMCAVPPMMQEVSVLSFPNLK